MSPRSRNARWPGAAAALVVIAGCGLAQAQIRTDGTLGGPALALTGPDFLIGEALGRLSGANLFHSFQTFNVGAAETATFVTTTPGLANVVSRVTGGTPSQIAGLLRLASTDAAPNFFFINPAGVTFSGDAAVDVPAAFHVSTADYLKFPDGRFYADVSRASTLSAAPPEAFGFLGGSRATVAVRDGAVVQTSLAASNQPVDLVAGDLLFDFGAVETGGSAIRAVAVGGEAQEVALTGPAPGARGDVVVRNGGYLASLVDGDRRSGDIAIAAGSLTIDGAYGAFGFTGVTTRATGDSTASSGNIAIDVLGDIALRRDGVISAESTALGATGSIRIAGGALTIADGGVIGTAGSASGRAGDVSIAAGDILIDGADRGDLRTGVLSVNPRGATGNVEVIAEHRLTIVAAGEIASDTFSAARAGNVVVRAGELVIDAQGSSRFTGISSDTVASGHGGDVDVAVTGALTIIGGAIASRAGATGDAGSVKVNAGTLAITEYGAIDAGTIASGRGGTVDVGADRVTLASGGAIRSTASASGNAGSVSVVARELAIDGERGGFDTGIISGANFGSTGSAGSLTVRVAGALSLANQGTINSDTFGEGAAGTVDVSADTIAMRTGSDISSDTYGAGRGGSISVAARRLDIVGGGGAGDAEISSFAAFSATGHAGNVSVTVTEALTLADGGSINSTTYGNGDAGTIAVSADRIAITGGSRIGSDTFFGSGRGGTVIVNARELTVADAGQFLSRISSDSFSETGDAGDVRIAVAGTLTLANGGHISSDAGSSGRAGTVTVTARNVHIDGGGVRLTGISSDSGAFASGDAGDVRVDVAETLTIVNEGRISSDTFSAGSAGRVTVSADSIVIAAGGSISSETLGAGPAGSVAVAARRLDIRGEGDPYTGIATNGTSVATGDAGSVTINVAETLSVASSGSISSGTSGGGRAGSVRVEAGQVSLDSGASIGAAATFGSSGQTGTVLVLANGSIALANDAAISITNDATVANPAALTPTLLSVAAPTISLASGGQITAAASGNVAASNVSVLFGPNLTLSHAAIATSARDGDGGAIAVSGDGVLALQNSQITTSVTGTRGNGGDIDLAVPIVVMQTGFVRANTAAAAASGGDVNVEVTSLLPSGSTLFVGGATPYTFAPGVFGFNVIQAAAPTGVSGSIVISTPALDISGTITTLPAKFLDAGGLARSPCAIVGGSSLSQVGRGGMPAPAGGVLRRDAVEALGAPRAGNPLASAIAADSGGPLQLTRPIVEPCGDRG